MVKKHWKHELAYQSMHQKYYRNWKITKKNCSNWIQCTRTKMQNKVAAVDGGKHLKLVHCWWQRMYSKRSLRLKISNWEHAKRSPAVLFISHVAFLSIFLRLCLCLAVCLQVFSGTLHRFETLGDCIGIQCVIVIAFPYTFDVLTRFLIVSFMFANRYESHRILLSVTRMEIKIKFAIMLYKYLELIRIGRRWVFTHI